MRIEVSFGFPSPQTLSPAYWQAGTTGEEYKKGFL